MECGLEATCISTVAWALTPKVTDEAFWKEVSATETTIVIRWYSDWLCSQRIFIVILLYCCLFFLFLQFTHSQNPRMSKGKQNFGVTCYSCSVEAPLTAVRDSGRMFCYWSLQNLSCSVRLDEDSWWTDIFTANCATLSLCFFFLLWSNAIKNKTCLIKANKLFLRRGINVR